MATKPDGQPSDRVPGPSLVRRVQQLFYDTVRPSIFSSSRARSHNQPAPPSLANFLADGDSSAKEFFRLCMSSHKACTSSIPHAPSISCRMLLLPQELQDEILHYTLLGTLPRQQQLAASELHRMGTVDHTNWDPVFLSHTDHICWRWILLGPYQGPPQQLVTTVDTWFRFPIALHINSKTRKTMSEIFYRNQAFHLRDQCPRRWLGAVPIELHDSITLLTRTRGPAVRSGCGQKCWIVDCQNFGNVFDPGEEITLNLLF